MYLQASSARLGLLCNRLYSEVEKANALKHITIQVSKGTTTQIITANNKTMLERFRACMMCYWNAS
jgi:hypothetical protein